MKWLLAIAVAFAIFTVAEAQQSDAYGNRFKYSATAFTNAALTVVGTVYTSPSSYHTFQLVSPSAFAYSISRSVDGTNWFIGATNVVAANFVAESTIEGKYPLMRVSALGTNTSFKIAYFGGGQ